MLDLVREHVARTDDRLSPEGASRCIEADAGSLSRCRSRDSAGYGQGRRLPRSDLRPLPAPDIVIDHDGTMRTLISNGTVVTAATANEADVVIDGERVTGVVAPGTAHDGFDRVIDATGRYVIPGGVDMHTHMELPVSGTHSCDTYETGTRAAAIGGTTTIVDYAGAELSSIDGRSLRPVLEGLGGRPRPERLSA